MGRGDESFADLMRDRTLVNLATTEPAYSTALEHDVRAAGGR